MRCFLVLKGKGNLQLKSLDVFVMHAEHLKRILKPLNEAQHLKEPAILSN